ncbi:MAG: hypothetical protein JWM26_2014 [Betaproteobacteria bacterium]|nr:hypothetical protein [Betaproteobacteria bacterium]
MPRLSEVMKEYKCYRVYAFNQAAQLMAIDAMPGGGVCTSITFDWLRRRILGAKNFNDPVYSKKRLFLGSTTSTKGRERLITKHKAMHVALAESGRDDTLAAFDQANPHVKRPFAKLAIVDGPRVGCADSARDYEPDPNKARKVIDSLTDTGRGDYNAEIAWKSRKVAPGHSVGAARRDGTYWFFDPNLGEYQTNDASEFAAMVLDAWTWYAHTHELTTFWVTWVNAAV